MSKCNHCNACINNCKMDVKEVGDHECIQCGDCMKSCGCKAIKWKIISQIIKEDEEKDQQENNNQAIIDESKSKKVFKIILPIVITLIFVGRSVLYIGFIFRLGIIGFPESMFLYEIINPLIKILFNSYLINIADILLFILSISLIIGCFVYLFINSLIKEKGLLKLISITYVLVPVIFGALRVIFVIIRLIVVLLCKLLTNFIY